MILRLRHPFYSSKVKSNLEQSSILKEDSCSSLFIVMFQRLIVPSTHPVISTLPKLATPNFGLNSQNLMQVCLDILYWPINLQQSKRWALYLIISKLRRHTSSSPVLEPATTIPWPFIIKVSSFLFLFPPRKSSGSSSIWNKFDWSGDPDS